jgi:hypothetical protein
LYAQCPGHAERRNNEVIREKYGGDCPYPTAVVLLLKLGENKVYFAPQNSTAHLAVSGVVELLNCLIV